MTTQLLIVFCSHLWTMRAVHRVYWIFCAKLHCLEQVFWRVELYTFNNKRCRCHVWQYPVCINLLVEEYWWRYMLMTVSMNITSTILSVIIHSIIQYQYNNWKITTLRLKILVTWQPLELTRKNYFPFNSATLFIQGWPMGLYQWLHNRKINTL